MKINLNTFKRYRFLQLYGELPDRWQALLTWERRERHNLARYHIEYTLDYYLYRGQETCRYKDVYTLIHYNKLEPFVTQETSVTGKESPSVAQESPSVAQESPSVIPSFSEWRDVRVIAVIPI